MFSGASNRVRPLHNADSMKRFSALAFSTSLFLAACGVDGPKSPMAGNWSEVLPDGTPGMTLTFDGYSDKMSVHGRPQADGTHTHPKATYAYDEATQALTVTGQILDGDKGASWRGKVVEGGFELVAGATTLKFERGGEAHGH